LTIFKKGNIILISSFFKTISQSIGVVKGGVKNALFLQTEKMLLLFSLCKKRNFAYVDEVEG